MRTFKLNRKEDVNGLSGTGIVAEGVEFSHGQVVLNWLSDHPSVEMWKSIDDLIYIHGHEGRTEIVWDGDRVATNEEAREAAERVIEKHRGSLERLGLQSGEEYSIISKSTST